MVSRIILVSVLSLFMLLCIGIAARGYEWAEGAALCTIILISHAAGMFGEPPLCLPKINTLDLRRGNELDRFLAAHRKEKGSGRAGMIEPFPPGWYASS